MLGELIRERVPLLVPEIAADPRSVGFPPNHPPMRTLLGDADPARRAGPGQPLPDRARSTAGRSTSEDLAAVQVLAAHAATAIDRAQLYRQVEPGPRAGGGAARPAPGHPRQPADRRAIIRDRRRRGRAGQRRRRRDGLRAGARRRGAAGLRAGLPAAPAPTARRCRASERPALRALRGETVRNQQSCSSGADGRRLPVLVQAAPLRDARGAVDRAVVVVQDITRLRQAEQLKDDFLSLISHEFRTPLTAIHGGAHLLASQGDALDAETRRELLDRHRGRERAPGPDARQPAQPGGDHGRPAWTPATEPVLLEPLARRVAARSAARSPGHRFVVEHARRLCRRPRPTRPCWRRCCATSTRTPSSTPRPAARSAPRPARRRQRHDSGHRPREPGSPPSRSARSSSASAGPGADRRCAGMGLGLYLSRQLVEAQGGRIAAASPGPGPGADLRGRRCRSPADE